MLNIIFAEGHGRFAKIFLEVFGKIGGGIEANGARHLIDAVVGSRQKCLRDTQAVVDHVLVQTLPHGGLEHAVDVIRMIYEVLRDEGVGDGAVVVGADEIQHVFHHAGAVVLLLEGVSRGQGQNEFQARAALLVIEGGLVQKLR